RRAPVKLPARARDVPHPPDPVLDQNPRRRRKEGIHLVPFEHGCLGRLPERFTTVIADRTADVEVERHRDAKAPTRVVLIEATVAFDDAGARDAGVVEGAERPRLEYRLAHVPQLVEGGSGRKFGARAARATVGVPGREVELEPIPVE